MYSKEEKVDMEMIQDVDDDELHAELVQMVMCGDDNDGVLPNPSTDFDAMGTNTITEREIWRVDERENHGNLLDLNDSSSNMFYDEQFPVLPNFSPMSASSSSSSTPAPTKPIVTSSASSASTCSSATASWAMLKLDNEEDMENKDKDAPAPSGATLSPTLPMEGLTPSDGGTIDCMELMEGFGYMDLLDSNEIWDPSSIFDQTPQELLQLDDQFKQDDQQHDEQVSLDHFIHQEGRNENRNNDVVEDEEKPFDEMGLMFLEWLKSNKDTISAEDLRSIKLKTSTVDCATKRLGNSKEGQKKLVKLILDWVAKCQLRKKREEAAAAAAAAASAAANQYPYPSHEPPPQIFPNPNPNYNYGPPVPTADPNSRFSPPPWIPAAPPMQSYVTDPAGNMMAAPPPAMAYMGSANTYNNPSLNCANPYNNYEYQMLDSSQPWNQSQMTMAASHFTNPYNDHMGHMGNNNMVGPGYVAEQYPYTQMYNGNGDQMLMKSGSSATKEARKKRMARQRRFSWNHHPRHHHPQQNHQNQANFDNCSNKYMGNWGYWAPAVAAPGVTTMQMMAAPPPPPQMDAQPPPPPAQQVDQSATHGQNGPKQTPPADKKQGWKSEKNLKFLLQKVLKQSDVGNLGRIVLPKKEAETHLPELESRDGISISMEDIGTSKVWDMRYRFWPNNKSRMYLLENTGDFVKANELQEGDFIVLYSDMKYGKYLIRGVKVREPGKKPEPTKKPTKRNQRNGTSSSPNKKHHKKENEKEKEGGDNV